MINPAVAQVLLSFLNRAAPNQTKIGISRQRNIGQVEFVVGTDILRPVLVPQNILPVNVDFLVLANLDGYLSLSLSPAVLIN
jgi:hypothetical protein